MPALSFASPYDILYLALVPDKEQLNSRIAKRLDTRLRAGMMAEVKKLHAQGVSWKRLESFGLEYRWIAYYLQKKVSRMEIRDGLLRDIIKYSKRQMTWLRRNKDVVWLTSPAQATKLVRQFLLQ